MEGGWAAAAQFQQPFQQPASWDLSTPCVGVDAMQHDGKQFGGDGGTGGHQSHSAGGVELPVRDRVVSYVLRSPRGPFARFCSILATCKPACGFLCLRAGFPAWFAARSAETWHPTDTVVASRQSARATIGCSPQHFTVVQQVFRSVQFVPTLCLGKHLNPTMLSLEVGAALLTPGLSPH